LLPIALFAETSGTYINNEGKSQSFNDAIAPVDEIRPAWKVLRVLGNVFNLQGFDYRTSLEVRDELQVLTNDLEFCNTDGWSVPTSLQVTNGDLQRITDIPMNGIDPLVRHAQALQLTTDVVDGAAHVNSRIAHELGVNEGDSVKATQDDCSVALPIVIDEKVPDHCVLIHAAQPCHSHLGPWNGDIALSKA
jgi:NADH-quinone oxidoreductase subunit G